MSPSPDPEAVQWVYDEIPHYRLNPEIIDDFLSSIWGGYEFYVEACASCFSAIEDGSYRGGFLAQGEILSILGSTQAEKGESHLVSLLHLPWLTPPVG